MGAYTSITYDMGFLLNTIIGAYGLTILYSYNFRDVSKIDSLEGASGDPIILKI